MAASIDTKLAAVFTSDFELGMAQFRRLYPKQVARFLREMALFFTKFEPGETNAYCELVWHFLRLGSAFILATLNYDLLLEYAVSRHGRRFWYTTPDQPSFVPILKLHGSCNFIPDVGSHKFENVTFVDNVVDFAGPVKIALPDEAAEYCRSETTFAPAVALYAEGKDVLMAPSIVHHQQAAFANAVAAAEAIFVIGVRVNVRDSHIWTPLARSRGPLWFVDPKPEQFETWASREGRSDVVPYAESFTEAVVRLKEHYRP